MELPQKQGLQWCLDHEYPVLPKVEFYSCFLCALADSIRTQKPEDKVVQFWKFVKADEV